MTIQIDQLRIAYKNPCRFATTANINLSTTGLTAIDGVTPVAGDRALVKDQSAGAENGIYIAASTAWVRSQDFNAVSADSLEAGVSVFVQEGTANALNSYILTTTGTIVLDTTALTFIEDITGGAQPLDADLTALAALSTTGIVTRTAADTYLTRTITGTTDKITVTNGDGVAGNPTLTVGSDIVQLDATQTLTAKTLTTPTIASFVNATHDHQAAAGGGQLDHGLALSNLTWTSSAHTGTANRLASFGGSGEATETLVSATAAATTVPLADGAGHIDLTYIDIDDSTLEDATNVLQVKDAGITEVKLSFTFETEIIAASAFSFSATRSTFTLLGAASSTNSNVIDGFQLFKNGVNDQTRVTTTAATNEFSLAGATLSVHDDITSTGATYKIVYIAA